MELGKVIVKNRKIALNHRILLNKEDNENNLPIDPRRHENERFLWQKIKNRQRNQYKKQAP